MELGHTRGPPPGRPRPPEALRLGDGRRGRLHRPQEPRLKQERPMFFHQRFVPGLAIYSYMVGDEKSKQVRRHRPDQGRGRVPRDRQAGGAADHARPGDARPRRLRERLGRAEGPAGRRGAGRRLRHGRRGVDPAVRRPGGRRRRRDRPGRRPAEGDPHPRPHLRARRVGAVRRHPEPGHALADLHRRLPVRRRRGPPRPAGRGGPQEAGPPAVRERLRRAARRCPTSPRSSPPTGPGRSAARRSAPGAPPARLRAAVQRRSRERAEPEWVPRC